MDQRMDKYATLLRDNLTPEQRVDVLDQFKALEGERRNLQNGMEEAVSSYKKQQSVLERIFREAGITANLRPRFNRATEEVSRPDFVGIRNLVYQNVNDPKLAESMLGIVSSLQQQFDLLTNGTTMSIQDGRVDVSRVNWSTEINRVNQKIRDLRREYFAGAVWNRSNRTRQASGESVTFAYLSQYLTRDEMSGLLLGNRADSAVFDYRFNADDLHPGHGLILDSNQFDTGTGNLTLKSSISDTDLSSLLTRDPSATGATTVFGGVEGVDVDVRGRTERAVRGTFHFNNNPFVEIKAASQQIEGAANLERITIFVDPRFPVARTSRGQIVLSLEIDNSLSNEEDRITRLPRLIEQFALANYDILSAWYNPVGKNMVVANTTTIRHAMFGNRDNVSYELTDDVSAQVVEIDKGRFVVGFTHNSDILFQPVNQYKL